MNYFYKDPYLEDDGDDDGDAESTATDSLNTDMLK